MRPFSRNRKKDMIRFCALKEGAKIPSKREEDAGFDIYPCFDEPMMWIQPHETVMIPTGIASVFDNKYVMILKERGSTGTKGIGQRSGVIDAGYRGEYMVPITNHNDNHVIVICKEDKKADVAKVLKVKGLNDSMVKFYPYEKAITQGLLIPVADVDVQEIDKETLKMYTSERGDGMLGSSGK